MGRKYLVTLPKPVDGVVFSIKPVGDDILTVTPGEWEIKPGDKKRFTATKRKWWQIWKKRYYWK